MAKVSKFDKFLPNIALAVINTFSNLYSHCDYIRIFSAFEHLRAWILNPDLEWRK